MTRRFIIAGIALALVATACGSDSNGEVEAGSTTSTAAVSETTSTTAPTEAAPLTASFRGVTPEVIRVGVLTYDWDRLAALGVNFGVTNTGDLALAALDAINDRGGIHGRMIEPYLTEFLPVGSTEADAVCVELTEDEEVFVVVGTTLNDQVLCFTELNDTAVVGVNGMTDARRSRSVAPYATVIAPIEQRTQTFIEMVQAAGVLDGATVGVIGSADVSEDAFRVMADGFRTAGFDPVEGLIGGNADDLSASAREQALIYERMNEAGVDVTVSTTGVPLEIANAVAAGYETDQWLLSTLMSGTALTDAGVPLEYLDGALAVANTAVGTSAQPALADDPLAAACIDDLVARTDHPLPYSLEPETNDISSGLFTCAIAAILEAALLAAGPDLTNDTFRAGLESIGEITLPGFADAFLGPDDMGAAKGLTLVEFDAATGIWTPVS